MFVLCVNVSVQEKGPFGCGCGWGVLCSGDQERGEGWAGRESETKKEVSVH